VVSLRSSQARRRIQLLELQQCIGFGSMKPASAAARANLRDLAIVEPMSKARTWINNHANAQSIASINTAQERLRG
jgi:hypothetical protein